MKSKKVTSLGDAITIAAFLKEHGHLEEGMWIYHNGWDDPRVARECPNIDRNVVGTHHVASVRNRVYGPIRKLRVNTLAERIAELEHRVALLDTRLTAAGA